MGNITILNIFFWVFISFVRCLEHAKPNGDCLCLTVDIHGLIVVTSKYTGDMDLSENKVPQIRMVYYHVPVSKDYSWVTFSDALI